MVIICSSAFIATARADWPQQDKLLSLDGSAGDHFGMSVSISGDYAVVWAVWDDGSIGSAYIFRRSDVPDDPNWTAYGVKALSLWFHGSAGNAADANTQMYAALKDTEGDIYLSLRSRGYL